MRIAQVIPYYFPAMSFGGPAKVVYEFSNELAKKHHLTILTSDAFNATRRIESSEKLSGTKNFSIKYFRNLLNSVAYTQRLFTHFSIIPYVLVNKNSFDIFHFHDVFVLPHIALGLLLKLVGKSYIVSPHGILDPVRLEKKSIIKSLLLPLVFSMFSNAKQLIATSEKEASDLRSLGFTNVVTVYNGIGSETTKSNKKFKHLADKKKITLLYIGKLHSQKGLHSFLQALQKQDSEQFQLLIAGIDDGDETRLQHFVEEHSMQNVKFLGFVNEPDKESLYEISDCFIHPSDSEGFSISILEALNNDVPVLITEACNFDEVSQYKAGTVLPSNETQVIAKALKQLSKKKLITQKANCKKLITEKFTIAIMAKNLEKIYESSIN